MKAYVEVKCVTKPGIDISGVKELLERIKKIEGVKEADLIHGHCDMIAVIERPDLKSLTDSVVKIRTIDIEGISIHRTETLICGE